MSRGGGPELGESLWMTEKRVQTPTHPSPVQEVQLLFQPLLPSSQQTAAAGLEQQGALGLATWGLGV